MFAKFGFRGFLDLKLYCIDGLEEPGTIRELTCFLAFLEIILPDLPTGDSYLEIVEGIQLLKHLATDKYIQK